MRLNINSLRAICLVLLAAHGSASAAEPPAYRVRGDLAIRARDIFQRYCSECHTGGDAPGLSKLKLMEHANVTGKKTPVPLLDPKGRSLLIELVKDGSMPPANRPGPTADEVATLETWVKADSPAYPIAFDERYTLAALADDFEQESAKIKDGTAREQIRYVSFAHLIREGEPPPDLTTAEVRLLDALSRTAGHEVKPEPVDAVATLFRIRTARFGSGTSGFERVEARKAVKPVLVHPFDLIQLEYPHAHELPPDDPRRKRLAQLFRPSEQVHPLPYLRGEWLTASLVSGTSLTPLAEELKSLPQLEQSLAQKDVPLPAPLAKPFAGAKPVTVPAAANGRTPIPPLSSWYVGDVTPEKSPFKLTAELVADGELVAGVKVDQPFALRVTCDKKVFLMLLMVQADGEIVIQEVDGGTVLLAGKERLLAPKGGFNISSILGGGDSATEHLVLFACEEELPLPIILRSKHPDNQLWRFLMEPTATERFDPNTVVRKVIPIKVTKK